MAKKRKQEMLHVSVLISAAPIAELQPHPENPRDVRLDEEFLASIRGVGVIEPLTVRELDGTWQVLSGHRRFAAAQQQGRESVPIPKHGEVGDREAFDIVAMANLHEDLTPLEEGKRAALWLDRYDQDAEAVAGKLGKTARWVVQHAQIHRNLVADWYAALQSSPMLGEMTDRWTASHWAVIARLPHRMQVEQVKKFQRGAYCSFDRWSVRELERRIGLEMLALAKAPFDTASCQGCLNRTGAQPAFLWADEADGATGAKEKCLDRKCWDKKCIAAEKKQVRQMVEEKGVPDALRLNLLTEPTDWHKHEAWRKQVRGLKKVHGTQLVGESDVELVKKGDKGAVPAIVVAGRGKGAVKWVKPKPVKKLNKADSAKRYQEQLAERQRWNAIEKRLVAGIGAMEPPGLSRIALLAIFIEFADDVTKWFAEYEAASDVIEWTRERLWKEFQESASRYLPLETDQYQALSDFLCLGIDVQAAYDEIVAAETETSPKKGRKKKIVGVCRVCGCTDDDCSGCIERTGEACHWVEPDLCSACVGVET